MYKLIITTAACLLVPSLATADMPYPKNPYSAKIEVTANGRTVPADMFISDSKIRMEMVMDEGPAAGRQAVFVADRKTGEAFTLADLDGRKMAIKMDINQAMKQINFSNQDLGPALGKKWIGFKRCTNYKTMAGTTCLTKDYMVLEAIDDESHMIVKKLKKGRQDPALFEVPSDYQVIDLGEMLGGFGGAGGGSIGGIDLGNLGGLGSPMEIGKALSEGENANNEGFNSIMQNLGLPTEAADTAAANTTFGGMLEGMIRDEVKGTDAEGIINGDIRNDPSFIEGNKMKNEMIEALENGEDPLTALMERNGVSQNELDAFRGKAKEAEALNAPGGYIDQQVDRVQSSNAEETLEVELKKLEAVQAETERLMASGQITDEDRARLDRETKEIEQRVFRVMSGE